MLASATSPTAFATNIWQFVSSTALLIGMLGSSATFGPLMADTSHWFQRERGLAVAICASGNYLAGTIWPPVLQYAISNYGWRATYLGIGIVCLDDHAAAGPDAEATAVRSPSIAVADARSSGAGSAAPSVIPDDLQPLLMLRRHRLLRRHVDAAGAYRRLLQRPRLWAGARRRDAVGDAGLRRHQPPRLGLSSPTGSAASARC